MNRRETPSPTNGSGPDAVSPTGRQDGSAEKSVNRPRRPREQWDRETRDRKDSDDDDNAHDVCGVTVGSSSFGSLR